MKKYDICILTPTYNRPQLLRRILSRLKESQDNYKIYHIIINDGSNKKLPYDQLYKDFNTSSYEINLIHHSENYGRVLFWKTYDELFKQCRNIEFKYLYGYSDDLYPCDNFFNRTIEKFETYHTKNSNYIVMNLLNNVSEKWEIKNFIDGQYIAHPKFLKVLKYKVNPIERKRFEHKPKISSGVHKQLTERIRRTKFKIVPNTKLCYVQPMDRNSQMFPGLVRTIDITKFIDNNKK